MKEKDSRHFFRKALLAGVVVSGISGVAAKEITLLPEVQRQSTPGYQVVVPFFPYTVTDSYSTQVCVSNMPGRVLPPFIISYTK